MAKRLPESGNPPAKRVFVNNVDSYASKYIAKFLSECVFEGPEASDGERDNGNNEEKSNHCAIPLFYVVGTCSIGSEKDDAHVMEKYFQLGRDELLSKLMDCDVIIYNITQHLDQIEEASWAILALYSKMDNFSGPKMFILISTVMTWACTKPQTHEDLELPFIDEDFRTRKAHPNFQQHSDLEKRVAKLGRLNRKLFSTYVVASGLQYGMEEQVFHPIFKMSWLGQEKEIPVFGEGTNMVPTIHVNDLASLVQNIIKHHPKPQYLLAVDASKNTMEDIVKAVASALGTGKIQKRPAEEAFLLQDMSVLEIDSMQINLNMEAVYLRKLFSIQWAYEFGLAENIEQVVEEYKQSRGLLPIRVCVLGPPAVGKSTLSKQLCKHYKLHHVKVKGTISETISCLEDLVKYPWQNGEGEGSLAEAQELLTSLKETMEQNQGLLDDHLLVKVIRDKLMSNPCKNQGFVLDGFPKTFEQAKELFRAEEHESEDGTWQISEFNKNILPEFLLCLDASDALLMDRVINLSEALVQKHNYELEHFLLRLARHREMDMEDERVLSYFDELDIRRLSFEITSSNEADCLSLMKKITEVMGPPRNYGPSSQEVLAEERIKAEEVLRRETLEREEEERRKVEEAQQRALRWEEWTMALEEARAQEENQLEDLSVPLKTYLMEQVMPTLTQGLIECCSSQPQDPVDFLAEYLIKNNPFHY